MSKPRYSFFLVMLACVAALALCPLVARAQDVFTGNQGFPATFKGLSDIPAPLAASSVQIPGNVELNECVRFVGTTVDACLCMDDLTEQIWSEKDCDGTYEGPTTDEFYLGSGTGGGGFGKVITDAVSEATAVQLGSAVDFVKIWGEGGSVFFKCEISGAPCPPDIIIPTGLSLRFMDETTPMLIVNPSGATPSEMWNFQPGYEFTGDVPVCDGSPTTATVTVSSTCTNKGVFYNGDNDAIVFNLPAAAAKKSFCFNSNTFAQAVTVNPDDADVIIFEGVSLSAGESIISSGVAGEFLCLHGRDDGTWFEWGYGGTWVQESP